MSRHLHIDPLNGIAGDMLLAALVDVGAPGDAIEATLNGIPFPEISSLSLAFPEAASHGVRGRRLEIALSPPVRPALRAYPELLELVKRAPVEGRARETALAVFERIGRAEANSRGLPLEEVRFHELGGFDTVIDVLGVALAVDALGVASVTCGPVPLSRGKTACKHGPRPTPAPATLDLLTGVPVHGVDVDGEIVTVTGAALAVSLADSFAPPPPMTLRAAGAGFGTSVFPGRPNCLRVLLGDRPDAAAHADRLVVLEANLDDQSPEVLATLPGTCLDAGALDAWLTPALMKKGRPGHVLHALCAAQAWAPVEEVIFRHSSTLGVRRHETERRALERTWEEVGTPWGTVRVKVGWLGGESVNRAPEFEDCRRAAEAAGVPLKSVYEAALAGREPGQS